MSEWKRVKLSEVASFNIGGTPSRNTPAFWSEKPLGHPWLSIADLKEKYVSDTAEHISDLGASTSNTKLIPEGTTVMSFKLTVGRTAITAKPMFCNEAIAFFEPKEGLADGRWLYHELPRASKRVVTDTAVKGATLNKKKIAEIPLLLPPEVEQQKIAQILDTLDTQTRQTEALIAKLERIKQGLLTDLLTRGIDQNGQLRPTPDQAPHLYKSSPLGRIPREWECKRLSDLSLRITYGFTNPMPATVDGPWMVTAADIEDGVIRYESARHTASKAYALLTDKSRPKIGDILITKDGTLGRVALLDRPNVCINQSVAAVKPRFPGGVTFLVSYLQSLDGQARMLADAGGSTIKHLYISKLGGLMVPWPPASEAIEISTKLVTMDARIAAEKKELEKARSQKTGLMDDLLTGCIRVTQLLETQQRCS